MPPGGINKLRDLIDLYFGDGVLTRYTESDVSVGTTSIQLVGPNPQRVVLYLYNLGAATVAFGMNSTVTATTGIGLPSNSGMVISWFDDLALVGQGFFGISLGVGNAVHVIETFMVGEVG